MERQERKAAIISFVVIGVFMGAVAGAQSIQGAVHEQKMNLLADIANVSAPATHPPAPAPATTTQKISEAKNSVTVTQSSSPKTTPAIIASSSRSYPSSSSSSGSDSSPAPVRASAHAAPPATTTPPTRTLPYSIGTFGNHFGPGDGWTDWVGDVSQANGLLTVSADPSTTVGNTLFSGSDGWSNYTFQANLDWIKGETLGLIARYVDPKDYLVCEYDEPAPGTIYMSFQKHMDGVVTSLATANVNNYEQMGGDGITAAIEVEGNTGTCSFNGHQVSTFAITPSGATTTAPQSGEIGLTIWDPNMDDGEIVVHSVGVMNGAYQL